MTERALGFYWVKRDGEWIIAEWTLAMERPKFGHWLTTRPEYEEGFIADSEFDEIGERVELQPQKTGERVARLPGFYWVKPVHNENWQIARWNGYHWYDTYQHRGSGDTDLLEIGECVERL